MNRVEPRRSAYDTWAEYYDLTDADRTPFIDFYRALVTPRTRSLLELGCGTGTITIALARVLAGRGGSLDSCRVVGVDESSGMLTAARARDDAVDWMLGDIRSLPVDGPFDLVISCFNTLQHLLADEDLALAFGEVWRVISPEGVFAFDIYQPNTDYLARPQRNRLARSVTTEDGRRLEIREDTRYDPGSRVLTIDWRLVEQGTQSPPKATARYQMSSIFPRTSTGSWPAQGSRYWSASGTSTAPCSRRPRRNKSFCARQHSGSLTKRVAVMQPYFFPYGGYFSLLATVDEFVVFDSSSFRAEVASIAPKFPVREGSASG